MSSINRKRRRLERHLRNKENDTAYKQKAWESGKLIEENHNNGPYSLDYTSQLSQRLYDILHEEVKDEKAYLNRFIKYKQKIQTLILHWNSKVNKGEIYNFLKSSLELYWDEVLEHKNLKALYDRR